MKKTLLIFILLISFSSFSQAPPPPSCLTFDKIDSDNDGFATFEIDYYLTYIRNYALSLNYNLSGYNLVLYPSEIDYNNNSNPITTNNYQNIIANAQYCYLKFTYSGTGNYYDESNLLYNFSCHVLTTHSPTGDFDNDNVVNSIEDLNSNLILIDEDTNGNRISNFKDNDDDGDTVLTINEDYNNNGNLQDDDVNSNGIIDYLDNLATGVLYNEEQISSNFKLFPNPFIDVLNIDIATNFDLEVIDNLGRIILKIKNAPQQVNLSNLKSGLYSLQIETDNKTVVKKIFKK